LEAEDINPIKICGFTFVKNAVKYDFPIKESILSALPVCNKFIVALGDCDDGSRELLESIGDPKILIIDTIWDETQKKGGVVYALETDKAFNAIGSEYDWCLYLQGDEVLHEKDYPAILNSIRRWHSDKEIDGFLFNYYHFYGSYDYLGDTRKWYRNEIRVIRNDKSIHSYRDAQGFRKNGKKLLVAPIDATIYHYGWVRPPERMRMKVEGVRKYYTGAEVDVNLATYDYDNSFDALKLFEGTHSEVMKARIQSKNWEIRFNLKKKRMTPKYKFLYYFEKIFGKRLFEYRNYTIHPKIKSKVK
jgi:hypothetical protein